MSLNITMTSLFQLADLLAGNWEISDLRSLDRKLGTTYFTDFTTRWPSPDYVPRLGLQDTISDNLIDWFLEHSPELASVMIEAEKENSSPNFTPSRDLRLREELALDRIENAWIGGIKRSTLKGELAKAGVSLSLQHRMTADAREFLRYALYARRKRNERLFLFCVAGLLRSEFNFKFFYGNPDAKITSTSELQHFRAIAGIHDDTQPNAFFTIARQKMNADVLSKLSSYMNTIDEQGWPSGHDADDILGYLLGLSSEEGLLTRMTCEID